jgi:hypothetical protein
LDCSYWTVSASGSRSACDFSWTCFRGLRSTCTLAGPIQTRASSRSASGTDWSPSSVSLYGVRQPRQITAAAGTWGFVYYLLKVLTYPWDLRRRRFGRSFVSIFMAVQLINFLPTFLCPKEGLSEGWQHSPHSQFLALNASSTYYYSSFCCYSLKELNSSSKVSLFYLSHPSHCHWAWPGQ